MPVSHRASNSSISPGGWKDTWLLYRLCVCTWDQESLHTWIGLPVGAGTCMCESEKGGHIFGRGADAKNSSGLMYVRATNVMLNYFDLTASRGSSSLMIAYARLNLPCCGKKQLPAGTWQSSGRKCEWSCDKYFQPKMCPPQFHIPGGIAKGQRHVQRDLFDLHQWSFFVCVCVRSGGYTLSQYWVNWSQTAFNCFLLRFT